jgi:hypothetical protein
MFAPRSKRGGWNGGVPWRTAKPPYRGSGSFLIGGGGSSNRKGYPSLISGSTLVSPGAKLLLVYADGSRQRIKVIWVSKPIGAGFYYHPIPRTHQTRTRRVIALELIRGSHLVARQVLPVLKFAVGRGGSAS